MLARTVLSPAFTDPGGRYDQYADLRVRAALDVDGDISDGRCYAWAYEFRPVTVHLPRAQSMVSLLRRTDRRLAPLARQLGSPTDFADYLARFALVLGITVFAEHCAQLRPDGTHWRWMDVDRMRAWIHQ